MDRWQIGVVASLWRHPVKSMLGEQLAQVLVTERGVIGDRAWALRELATRQIVSAKKFARMYAFRATCDEEPAPGRLAPVSIRLPDGSVIRAEDPDASEQIGAALGRKVKLERAEDAGREHAGIDPKTVFADVPVEKVIPGLTAQTMPADFGLAAGTFFDSAVMHVLASGTLRHMSRLTAAASIFDPRRFRPSIYVDTGAADDHFIEDDWLDGVLAVGESVRIASLRPALRCVMTTHAQDDLPQDYRVLRTAAYHHRANAGVFAAVAAGGMVRVGDPVFLEK
jgi:MOSC domain-containing protein